MRVLTLQEIRELDRRTIEETGIPSLVLMENAALAVVEAVGSRYPGARRVGVVAGPGNNGADGLAVARQLDARGYDVQVLFAPGERPPSAECATQRKILSHLGIEVTELADLDSASPLQELEPPDLWIDALFGAGLTRPLTGVYARLVEALNSSAAPILAVDLPSGLDGDRQHSIGPCIAAATTVTLLAPKPALVLPPACDLAGEVIVGDLGFRFEEGGGAGALHVLIGDELGAAVPRRAADAHKGSFGHVLLVAGSRGKAGAMVLSARASVVGGAGLTTVALAAGLELELAAGCPEAMSIVLTESAGGALEESAAESILEAAAERSVLAIGPGIGRAPGTASLVRRLVAEVSRPLVLDADGLNAFEDRLDEIAARSSPSVLTPHPGELSRLLGRTTAEIQEDRLGAVREAARRCGGVVVLKGRRTLIATPDGETWVNTTGNPGMASGGSGDVLTGLIAARLAQGDEAAFAACLSVHLHGLAGDLARARLEGPAVPAAELLADYGGAFATLVRA